METLRSANFERQPAKPLRLKGTTMRQWNSENYSRFRGSIVLCRIPLRRVGVDADVELRVQVRCRRIGRGRVFLVDGFRDTHQEITGW